MRAFCSSPQIWQIPPDPKIWFAKNKLYKNIFQWLQWLRGTPSKYPSFPKTKGAWNCFKFPKNISQGIIMFIDISCQRVDALTLALLYSLLRIRTKCFVAPTPWMSNNGMCDWLHLHLHLLYSCRHELAQPRLTLTLLIPQDFDM